MKTLCYTLKDAHNWAEFSGDYNPIHFDLHWVQKHKGDNLSVHGMRVLLDVKQFTSSHFLVETLEINQAIKCVIRIRHPLWNDIKYSLVTDHKLGSSAILMTEGKKCITCRLSLVPQIKTYLVQNSEHISAIDLLKLQRVFDSYFPKLPLWIFFDAVIFQHIIENMTISHQDSIADLLPNNASLNDVFANYSVVQTHQEVIFDPEFLQTKPLLDKNEALHVHIQPVVVTGDVTSGLLVCIQAVAEYQHKFITNSITLKISSTF